MSDRERKAAEVAMKRRRGASRAHSEKVRANMLSKDDLYTTCKKCGQQVTGTLADIQQHGRECDGT